MAVAGVDLNLRAGYHLGVEPGVLERDRGMGIPVVSAHAAAGSTEESRRQRELS